MNLVIVENSELVRDPLMRLIGAQPHIRAAGSLGRVLVLTNSACDALRCSSKVHGISGFYDKTA